MGWIWATLLALIGISMIILVLFGIALIIIGGINVIKDIVKDGL